MAFFKKVKQKVNGLWYPKSVTVGKPVTTDEVADRLSKVSTVSRGDTYAVLKELGPVLGDYMAQGRTVKLDGVGTFYYTSNAAKNGVETSDKVDATLITGVFGWNCRKESREIRNRVAEKKNVPENCKEDRLFYYHKNRLYLRLLILYKPVTCISDGSILYQ